MKNKLSIYNVLDSLKFCINGCDSECPRQHTPEDYNECKEKLMKDCLKYIEEIQAERNRITERIFECVFNNINYNDDAGFDCLTHEDLERIAKQFGVEIKKNTLCKYYKPDTMRCWGDKNTPRCYLEGDESICLKRKKVNENETN